LYILCLTCFKKCPTFVWQYMEPNTKYFMCTTSSYSTLLPTSTSLRTTGHSTQLIQKPFSTFKPKITHLNKANVLTLILILSSHHCLCLLCCHFRRALIATHYSIPPPIKTTSSAQYYLFDINMFPREEPVSSGRQLSTSLTFKWPMFAYSNTCKKCSAN